MISNKFNFFFIILILFFKINIGFSAEIKILVKIDNLIITNEDLRKEKVILKYLFNIDNSFKDFEKLALNNLIDLNIKRLEIEKTKILISDSEIIKLLKAILKNNNKSLDDFRLKTKDKDYEDYLIDRIKIEISWNRLILKKYSNLININLDEILAKNYYQSKDKNEIEKQILTEKNKKLQTISDGYFNEIKNKTLIKYL